VTYADFYKISPANSLSLFLVNRKLALMDSAKFEEIIFCGTLKNPVKVELEPQKKPDRVETTDDEKIKLELEELKNAVDKLTLTNFELEQLTETMSTEKSKLKEEVQRVREMLAAKEVEFKVVLARVIQGRREVGGSEASSSKKPLV